ncbi:D-inositol-3-phosphate glycosyltransferase [compost metagenome]
MARILVITDDRLGSRMAGPAIRAFELACQLSAHHDVTLASLQPLSDQMESPIPIAAGLDRSSLFALAARSDILLAGGYLYAQHPGLFRLGKYTVLDLYDPMLFEELASHGSSALDAYLHAEHHRHLAAQMQRADFMICASERQRDYWLGRLCALGRLGPALYATDPSAQRLIDVVPFGLSSEPPRPGPARIRGILPGVDDAARIFLWGGGIWEWFDPLTPIRAAASLQHAHPEIKLVFLAGKSPNPGTPTMPMADAARALARELGAMGRSVHFLEDWIPYQDRGALLLEADAAFTAHRDHLETRFSFRTRVLDYLWAGLPILTTAGDSMADLVTREALGEAIAAGDVEGWAAALLRTASDDAGRAAQASRARGVSARFTWEHAVAPLARYCEAPYHTPRPVALAPWRLLGPLPLLTKALLALKAEGMSGLKARAQRYLAKRSGQGAPHA